MPANTVQSTNNALYYKVKTGVKYTFRIKDKEVTQESPAIVRWNANNLTEEFISTSFGGHLASIKIGDKKTATSKIGQEYETQDLFLEFHSTDSKGQLVREMLSMPWGKSLTYSIVGKLCTCQEFGNINLEFARYMNKENGNYNNIVRVFEGVPFLEDISGRLNLFISNEKWRKNEDQVVLPPKQWFKKDGLVFSLTSNYQEATKDSKGIATIDPSYESEIMQLYTKAVDSLSSRLTKLQDYVAPVYVKPENDLPEFDTSDIGYTAMPY